MQKCINCGHENRPGVLYCENCGVSLSGKAPLDTKSVDSSSEEERKQLGVDESVLTDVRVQGASVFSEKDLLRLEIEGSSEPIVLKPEAETIFGRRDPATGAMPDVDLTPFAGYRMGVSRRHAAIRFGDGQSLNLWDLGSSNGTYLNGERLSAHRPYRMHDGDELRLGQMMIRVRFQSTPAEEEKKAEEPAAEVKPEAKAGADESTGGIALSPITDAFEKPANVEPEAEKPAEAKADADESTVGIALSPITDAFEIPEVAVQNPEEKAEKPVTKPADEPPRQEPAPQPDKQAKQPEESGPTAPPAQPDTPDTPSQNDEKKRD
jgi:predicted component of type VI protein secretion system